MPEDTLLFGEAAVTRGFITQAQLDEALAQQRRRGDGVTVGEILIELGFLTRPQANGLAKLQESLERALLVPDDNALIGQRLGGCLVLERIGSGGMGTTYRAHHLRLDRDVVVKVLHPRLVKIRGNLERFEREAHAAALLEHPSIVTVYDFDQQGAFHFIIMQYVDGQNLKEVLYERGRLGARRTVWVAARVLEGLAHAHAHGIVHRDVKPANIMLTREPRVKITDFGLVRMQSMATSEKLSEFGELLGTPQYMAPEQAYGGDIDPRTDLYSLGISMFELISGRTPFTGSTLMEVLEKQILATLPALRSLAPDATPELVAFVQRLAEKDPKARFQTATEAFEALRAVRLDESGVAPRVSPAPLAGDVHDVRDPSRYAPAAPVVTEEALADLRARLKMSAEMSLVAFESDEAEAAEGSSRFQHADTPEGGVELAPTVPRESDVRAAIRAAAARGDAEEAVPKLLADLFRQGLDGSIVAVERDVESAAPVSSAAAFYLGLAHERRGELEVARSKLALAVAFAPDHVPARTRLARVLTLLSRPDEARAVLEEGALICPNSAAAAVRLAEFLYAVAKDCEAAVRAYERAVGLAPQRWQLRQQLAWILYELGRHEEAEAVLREVVEWNDAAAPARELLERIERERANLAAAAGGDSSATLTDEGDLPPSPGTGARLERIRLAEASGRFDHAARLAIEGLEARPRSVWLRLALGRAFAALGRTADAAAEFKTALSLAPTNADARRGYLSTQGGRATSARRPRLEGSEGIGPPS